MAIYYIEQKSTTWIRVHVEADTPDQALEIGKKQLSEGDGYEADGSFEWLDAFAVVDEDGQTVKLIENE